MDAFNAHAMDPERYVSYYQNQAGGIMPGYAGSPAMYGAGFGGIFRNLFRMAIPLFKRGFSIAKPHLKTAAKNIVSDIVSNGLTHAMRYNQDGSGMLVMARKSVKRPPGKRRGRPAKKTKRELKKCIDSKRKRKGKQTKRTPRRKATSTIF